MYPTYTGGDAGECGGGVGSAGELCLDVVRLDGVLPPAQVLADRRYPRLSAARRVVTSIRHTGGNMGELRLTGCGVRAGAAVKDRLEAAEAEAGGAHVPAHAAVRVVVLNRLRGGVPPHGHGVLGAGEGSGLVGLDGVGLLLWRSDKAGLRGDHGVGYKVELVERPDGRVTVQFTNIKSDILHGGVLDGENVDLPAVLVQDAEPLVAGDPLCVGGEDLGPELCLAAPLPHQGEVALVAHYAGQERVTALGPRYWSIQTVS